MNTQTIPQSFVRKLYPKKQEWSKKGDFGKVMVIGGSRNFTGAPALAAMAALRVGSDITRIYAPSRVSNTIASFSPDMMSEPLEGDFLSPVHTSYLLEWSERFDSVVIGNGMCRNPDTFAFVSSFLKDVRKPCVIDADAIHALSNVELKPNQILTPHSSEFSFLSGSDPGTNLEKRTLETISLSKKLNTTILLKGQVDIISNGKITVHNTTGNSWMTKGGTGDTLAGMCGAFLAMGLEPAESASCAAYLNGLAGDMALKRVGPGMTASDVLASIPEALRRTIK